MKDLFDEKRCKKIQKRDKYTIYEVIRSMFLILANHFVKTPEFQRDLDPLKIDSIFKESNDNDFWFGTHGNIIIGCIEKEDKKLYYYNLDGQHRIEALKKCKNDFPINIQLIFFDSMLEMRKFFKSINQNSNFKIEYQICDDDNIQDIKIYTKKRLELVFGKAFLRNPNPSSNRYNIDEFIASIPNEIIKQLYEANEKEFDGGKFFCDLLIDDINKKGFKTFEKLSNKKLYHNQTDDAVFIHDFILALKNINWINYLLDEDAEIIIEPIRVLKPKIGKRMSNAVWNKYIGRDKAVGKCFDCKRDINIQHFECGHLKSHKNGGSTDLENLRPFCPECNRQLGSADFVEKSKKVVNEKIMKQVEKKLITAEDYEDEDEDDLENNNEFVNVKLESIEIKDSKNKQDKNVKNKKTKRDNKDNKDKDVI